MALDIDALAAQYTTTLDSTVPPALEDRGDGQATLGALERTQKWALGRWPNPAELRDDGAILRACQEVATGIDAYHRSVGGESAAVTRATQAAAWLLSRGA